MTALGQQTWFRSGDHALEGWVHRPDAGRAVGAVVIAPPFAQESLVTYRALRMMAVRAARRGFVAVRFSWSGTGDSEPAPAALPLADAWQRDLAAAVELARTASGIPEVDAIGVRFGAAIVAAAEISLRSRILWAPLSGRAFLRMQSSLLKMLLPADFSLDTHLLELCGFQLDDAAVESLRSLPDPRRAGADTTTARRVTIIDESNDDTTLLFGREPGEARVPVASIEGVLDALDPLPPAFLPEWAPSKSLVTTDVASGSKFRQTFVDIGPNLLPGILTEPLDGPPADAAALFVPGGSDPKGAGRIPQTTSLQLARRGVTSLRADRVGTGDAANPDDVTDPTTLTEDATRDVALAASWLAERTGQPIVGIGICVGAWLVARAATQAPMRHLVMVNNLSWQISRPYFDRHQRTASSEPALSDSEQRGAEHRLRPLRSRITHAVRFGAPYVIRYRLFSRLARDQVAEILLGAVPSRTSTRLYFGPTDSRAWALTRGPDSVKRLVRRGARIDVVHDPRIDHALISTAGLQTFIDLLGEEFEHPAPTTG